MIVIVVAIFAGIINLVVNGWHLQIGNGTHTVIVTAVETSGVFFKTNQIYVKTDATSSTEEVYCTDKSNVEALRNAQESQKKISISYVSYLSNGISNCGLDGGDIITGIIAK